MMNSEVIKNSQLVYNIVFLERSNGKVTFELNGVRFTKDKGMFKDLYIKLDYIYEQADLFGEKILDIIEYQGEIGFVICNLESVVYKIKMSLYSKSFDYKHKFCDMVFKNGHKMLTSYITSAEQILIDFNDGTGPHSITPNNYCSLKNPQNYNPKPKKKNSNLNSQNNPIEYINNIVANCNIITSHHDFGINITSDNIQTNGDDVYSLRPDLLILFKDVNDSVGLPLNSREEIDFICPECGSVKKDTISNIIKQGFKCRVCSDGISYAEKMMDNILTQFEAVYNFHERPKWGKYVLEGKTKQAEYDFLLPQINIIIEMDGQQHYIDKFFNVDYKQKDVDNMKDKIAIENGFKIIRIDCCYKNIDERFDYIKKSIITSELKYIFNLGIIDWEIVKKKALNSRLIHACKMWENGSDVKEIYESLKLSRQTVINYLKHGTDIGLCMYSNKLSNLRKAKKRSSKYYTWMQAIDSQTSQTIGVFYDIDNFVYNYYMKYNFKLSKKKIKWAANKTTRHVFGFEGAQLQFIKISESKYNEMIDNKSYINDIVDSKYPIVFGDTNYYGFYDLKGE